MHTALHQLENFLHQEDDFPLLIKVGLAHAQFETIHPFLIGNGRIGRLLISFLLSERNALQKRVLCLSHYFKRNRLTYYEHLQAVRDAGDWEGWLAFFLRGVSEVSVEAANTARKILVLREDDRRTITEHFGRGAGNGHRVLEHLYTQLIVSIENVQQLTGLTYSSVNQLIDRFVKHRIVNEITGQRRNRRFRYDAYT